MKLFLVKLLLLSIAVVSTVYFVGNQDNNIYKKKEIEPNILRLQALQHVDSLDILFMGSSHVYSGICPYIFDSAGLKSFDVGLNTAGVRFMSMVADSYFKKIRKRPVNIIVDINAAQFCSASDNFTSFAIHRYIDPPLSDEKLFVKYKLSLPDYLSIRFHSFDVAKDQIFRRSDIVMAKNKMKYEIGVKGFWTYEQRADGDMQNDSFNKVDAAGHVGLKTEEYSKNREDEMLFFLDSLQRQGINVIAIEIPNNVYDHFFTNDYIKSYNQFWGRLTSAGIKNVRKPDGYNYEDFRDPHHLNINGAQKYSRYLLGYLKQNNFLR